MENGGDNGREGRGQCRKTGDRVDNHCDINLVSAVSPMVKYKGFSI